MTATEAKFSICVFIIQRASRASCLLPFVMRSGLRDLQSARTAPKSLMLRKIMKGVVIGIQVMVVPRFIRSPANQCVGQKEVNYDAEFWADHDEDCHGSCESFEDEFEAQEGFTWSCCETTGDNAGCKITKHKAEVNVLKPPIVTPLMDTNQKTKDSCEPKIAIPDIKWAPSVQRQWIQCGQCPEEYDPTDNERLECQYHPGIESYSMK